MKYYNRREDSGLTLAELLLRQINPRVTVRFDKSIPGMLPAKDVWVFAEDSDRDPDRVYMTIKNPSKSYRNAYST